MKKTKKASAPAKKPVAAKKNSSKRELVKQHKSFIGLLGFFAAFSAYAMVSFFGSTNDYIDQMYASVTLADEDGLVQQADDPTEDELEAAKELEESKKKEEEKKAMQTFADLALNHPNAEAIEALYEEGVITGYNDGTFKPTNTINRAELLTILTNAIDADFGGKTLGDCFADVKSEWYAVFVCYAKEHEWVSGFSDNSYRPAQPITKAEALKIVFAAFDYEACEEVSEKPYKDVDLKSWYAPYACKAKEDGIVEKSPFFSAGYHITRAEFVQMVYNVMVNKELL